MVLVALMISVPCRITAGAAHAVAWPAALADFSPDVNNDAGAPFVVRNADGDKRIVTLPDVAHAIAWPRDARAVVLTHAHMLATSYNTNALRAGKPGAALKEIGNVSVHFFDATNGDSESTWFAGADGAMVTTGQVTGVSLAHRDTHYAGVRVANIRIVRTSRGFAVAWMGSRGKSHADPWSLWLLQLDAKGNALAEPQHVDSVPTNQNGAHIALAADGGGVVVGWDPMIGQGESRESINAELRVFRTSPGEPLTLVRKLPLTSLSWSVAGSAGGVLPNAVQAITLAGHAVLTWTEFAHDSAKQRIALANGGDITSLLSAGTPRLSATPASLIFSDQQKVQTHALSLDGNCSAWPVAPVWAPPALQNEDSLTAAECERYADHVLKLNADPELRKALSEPGARKRVAVYCRAKFTRARYTCAMAATDSAKALDGCE